MSSESGDFLRIVLFGGELATFETGFGEGDFCLATGWKARLFFTGAAGCTVVSVLDFLMTWKARIFFFGGSGTTGGFGANTAGVTGLAPMATGIALRVTPGDSTLFFLDIAGDTFEDDGVDGEDFVVLGPKYFISSTSSGFFRDAIGDPSTLDTEDGVPILALALVGVELLVGKYLDRLTPCNADTSLLGRCFGFGSNWSFLAEVKNLETSFSLRTPTIRGPSTADLIDCILLWNFLASTFFMRLSSAAWSFLICSRNSSASSRIALDDFGRLRRLEMGVLRPLLRSSLNISSKAASSLPAEGVGEAEDFLCLRCFFRDGVGEGGISGVFDFLRDGVGDGGTSGRFCFFREGVGDGGGLSAVEDFI